MATTAPPAPTVRAPGTTAPGSHPRTLHPVQARLAPLRASVRDFYAGTHRVHERFKEYLPKHELESPEAWRARARSAEVFDALKRSVKTGAGLLFSRPIVIGADVPRVIREHLEAVDGAEEHLDVFARRITEDALQTGFGGILVDVPPAPKRADGRPLTIAEEDALGIRPYWVWYSAEDIVSWRHTRDGARTVLAQLVLHETEEVEEGEFGTRTEERWRILRRVAGEPDRNGVRPHIVTWRVVAERIVDGKAALQEVSSGVIQGQDEIPFSPFPTSTERGRWDVEPPKLGLTDLVLAHWRVTTDRRWNLSLSLVPVAVRKGYIDRPRRFDDDDDAPARSRGDARTGAGVGEAVLAVGSTAMIDLPADGDFKWVVAPSEATTHAMTELDALERRMGAVEFSFMFSDRREEETAEAKRINSAAQNATLVSVGRAAQDCLEGAIIYHARYLRNRLPGAWTPKPRDGTEGGSLSVNTDFESTVMSPELLRVLNEMAAVHNLPLRVLYVMMQRGQVLPEGETPDALVREVMAQYRDEIRREAGGEDDGAPPPAPDEGDEEGEGDGGERGGA